MSCPNSRFKAGHILDLASTPAAPNLSRLRKLRGLIERALDRAYDDGYGAGRAMAREVIGGDGKTMPRAEVAELARHLAGNRMLDDKQAIEWLEDAARRAT